ncbi:hypothetical protein [Ruegeria arenilitoris]|uniref:hypothetical protein n=1 Tax=Ruegeria arenilitoris TaxID=1173585 RepID=UPI0014800271|nr:hypothetical protein [Ruegeria arenilitoris]
MEVINNPAIANILQNLKVDSAPKKPNAATPALNVDFSIPTKIEQVLTVDAGLQTVPNPIRREKAMSFINPGVSILSLDDLKKIANDPMMDPRDMGNMLSRCTLRPAYLPLRGVRMTGRTMRDTLREIINASLLPAVTGLYEVLEFLLFEQWLPSGSVKSPRSMNCLFCRDTFDIPEKQIFSCPHCGFEHFLSDYLGLLSSSDPVEQPSETIANSFMRVLELLCLFRLPMLATKNGKHDRLEKILFIKDGSLMLRAEGFRVIDGVRRYLQWLRSRGVTMHLAGVEKTGNMVEFLANFPDAVPCDGDVLIPSRQFLNEEIQGKVYDPTNPRNRVSFGTRVGVRLSASHVVALQVPSNDLTNGGPENPKPNDLPELEEVVRALSKVTSSRYENSLIPLVLANRQVSLAQSSSSRLLEEYVIGLIS